MKTGLLALMLIAGSTAFAQTRVYVGIGVGGYPPPPVVAYAPPPPPPVVAYEPPYPGPGYSYVAGYYDLVGPRYVWRPGYWSRPPYRHARWVAPRYRGHHYYRGYWRR